MSNIFKKIIYQIIILVILSSIAVFISIYNSQLKERLFELRREVISQETLPEKTKIEGKRKDVLLKMEKIEPLLFNKNIPVDFIKIIEELSLQNNLEVFVESANFVEDVKDNIGEHLEISASLNGDIKDIRNFMKSVEEDIDKEIFIERSRIINQSPEKNIWRADLILLGKTK